jgi:hypothetical protein
MAAIAEAIWSAVAGKKLTRMKGTEKQRQDAAGISSL